MWSARMMAMTKAFPSTYGAYHTRPPEVGEACQGPPVELSHQSEFTASEMPRRN